MAAAPTYDQHLMVLNRDCMIVNEHCYVKREQMNETDKRCQLCRKNITETNHGYFAPICGENNHTICKPCYDMGAGKTRYPLIQDGETYGEHIARKAFTRDVYYCEICNAFKAIYDAQ